MKSDREPSVLVAVRDGFNLRKDTGLPAAGNRNDLALAWAGFGFLRSPIIRDGVALLVRESAVQAGAQPNAGKQPAKASHEENDALNDAGTDGMLEVTVLYPTKEMLLRGDADAAANDEAKRRQHEPIAPPVQGTDEGPGKARDDECDDATE